MSDWKDIDLSPEELGHYSRHLSIPEIGMEGQKKLKAAKVLAVGTGGLGAPLLQYLAAAGVGTIGIVDFDKVELHNLHRQILYSENNVGCSKADSAKKILQALNPNLNYVVFNEKITSENGDCPKDLA